MVLDMHKKVAHKHDYWVAVTHVRDVVPPFAKPIITYTLCAFMETSLEVSS